MALYWYLNPSQHLVLVSAEGGVTRVDVEAYPSEIERCVHILPRKRSTVHSL